MPLKPEIKKSAKLAILIPSVRWNEGTRGLIASTIGTANEEIAVLIGDNSENKEKKEFLKKIREINNNIFYVSHHKNIGAIDNLSFLLDWSKDVEYVAMTGDDDWMTSCYYPNALETLKQNPGASCCETGTAFIDFGDGKPFEISQPSMTGTSMMQRLTKWNAVTARVTMYSASRRSAIQAAVDFQKITPLHGLTMAENLWELNRLAVGDFLRTPATSYFIHYPANASNQGDPTQRFYNLLCKDAGLALPALDFMDLCSAIQCALFLMGKLSPLPNTEERFACGQKVFRHIYTQQFLQKFRNSAQKDETLGNITDSRLRARLLEYISPPYSDNPVLTEDVISLFVDLMGHFQIEQQSGISLSHRLRDFFDELMSSATDVSAPSKSEIIDSSADENRDSKTEHHYSPWSSMRSQAQSYPYDIWLKQREFLPEDSKVIDASLEKYLANPIHFHLVLRLQAGDEALLADTLDTLERQCYPAWHLDIVSTLPAPDGMNDLPCLGWHTIESQDDSAQIINALASSRLSGWVIELPPGARLDQLYLWRIAEQSVASPDAVAFFVDDDCCDDTGQRHSPRLKPGSNQSALLAADLAGPLAIRQDAWQTTGGASQVAGSPWYANLLRISEIAGWPGIQHIPDVLITYSDFFPSDPQSCMQALQKKFEREKVSIKTIPITKTSWRIRFPLDIAPAISIAIISRGQLDLLSRCIESLLNTTRYPDFQVIVAVTDGTADPDLLRWIEDFRTSQSIAIRVILLSDSESNFARLANAAANNTNNEFFVLLDENSFIVQESWLEELVRTGLQPDVAAVSPLLAKQGTAIVHNAGGVIGFSGLIGSPHCSKSKITDPGYLDCIQVARDVSVLPASCLLLRTKDFLSIGGMDESVFGNHLADADLCRRLDKAGRRLIFEPQAIVVHGEFGLIEDEADEENKARKQMADAQAESEFANRWLSDRTSDRFWNPNLSMRDTEPTPETVFRAQWQYLPSPNPRILARPVDNGQGFFRVTSPLRALRKAGRASECIWFQAKGRDLTAPEVMRLAPDTLIAQNYLFNSRLASLKACYSLPNRPFIVYALDDLITNLSKTNPFSSNIPPNSRGLLKYALAHSDRLVVSTDFLAETYRHLIPDIRVVANRLEQETWLPLRSQKRTGKKPRIGWAGGITHQGDLILLKEIIEQTRNEADWIFFGMCPEEIRPLLAEYHPLVDFHQYPAKLAALNLDIAVAPLAQIPFNQGKSNLRLLEYGILGIPVVCTDIDPYRGSPACCVENDLKAWTEALRARIFDADAREQEGTAIRKWVQKNYLLENHLEEWLSAHLPS